MKILFVFGTRPEAIKMAPVIKAVERKSGLDSIVCVTAQHREMLDQVLKIFNIAPDYDLGVMKKNQDLFDITSSCLVGLRDVYLAERPDLILVQGDTTTAFVAGLAAFYVKIPIGHIEAGLRTHNKYSPFPEEKNRHLLTCLADYHFAPTAWAKSNLEKERIPSDRIWVTGNTVIDALLTVANGQKENGKKIKIENYFRERWNLSFPRDGENNSHKLILVTGHRRENFGEGFRNICEAIKTIADQRKEVKIVYPVHLNPNVQQPVKTILDSCDNIHLIDPLEYEPFVYLMNKAYLILTDSGGIQEEAPSLGKPVLVMRDTTERPEGISAGTVKLVGPHKEAIISETLALLSQQHLYDQMSKAANPYGDGKAAERIVKVLEQLPG